MELTVPFLLITCYFKASETRFPVLWAVVAIPGIAAFYNEPLDQIIFHDLYVNLLEPFS